LIVLDTHVLVWALEDAPRLGARARALIDDAVGGDGVLISAITPWEIVMLVEKGRLALGRDAAAWIDAALAIPGLRLAPLTPAISVDSVRLPGTFHADPADRLIIATSREADATLITADRAILDYADAGYVKAADATK
jgi:PIN domain nuclease of toxin-antitoxin system